MGAPLHPQRLARLMQALQQVQDPEIGESIVELGLVESLQQRDDGMLELRLIPTSPTCPLSDLLVDDALAAMIDAGEPEASVEVLMNWDAEWSPERLSPALRERFGWQGKT